MSGKTVDHEKPAPPGLGGTPVAPPGEIPKGVNDSAAMSPPAEPRLLLAGAPAPPAPPYICEPEPCMIALPAPVEPPVPALPAMNNVAPKLPNGADVVALIDAADPPDTPTVDPPAPPPPALATRKRYCAVVDGYTPTSVLDGAKATFPAVPFCGGDVEDAPPEPPGVTRM